ncbi:hypothetical protein EDM76_00395 [bacterium]|nr:MAG: hypothetical protein EDM76_00395 [bacterium]
MAGQTADYPIMGMTDQEWMAQARARIGRGEDWEAPVGAPLAIIPAPPPGKTTLLTCPFCAGQRVLEVFRRYEVAATEPLLYCPGCYGFWAKGDALDHGVADPYDEHDALFAVRGPLRCRACAGRLDKDSVCRECGKGLPLLNCPSCGNVMAHKTLRGVAVDTCEGCKGTWFDVGELSAAFGLKRPQSLPMQTVDEHAISEEAPGWEDALSTALGLLLRLA